MNKPQINSEKLNMVEQKLKEIVLTPNTGYVEKETSKPVEILGGKADLGRVMSLSDIEDEERIRSHLSEAIFEVFMLNKDINGYILHTATPLSYSPRQVMLAFSAVRYQEKTTQLKDVIPEIRAWGRARDR